MRVGFARNVPPQDVHAYGDIRNGIGFSGRYGGRFGSHSCEDPCPRGIFRDGKIGGFPIAFGQSWRVSRKLSLHRVLPSSRNRFGCCGRSPGRSALFRRAVAGTREWRRTFCARPAFAVGLFVLRRRVRLPFAVRRCFLVVSPVVGGGTADNRTCPWRRCFAATMRGRRRQIGGGGAAFRWVP